MAVEMRLLGLLLAAVVGFAIAGFTWMYGTRTELLVMDDDIGDGFVYVGDAHLALIPLVPPFVNAAKSLGLQPGLVGEVEKASEQISMVKLTETLYEDPEDFKRFDHFQLRYLRAVAKLVDATAQEPGFKLDPENQLLRSEVETAVHRALRARSDYNEFLLQYNSRLTGFPGSIVGPREGLKTRRYFTDDASPAEAGKAKP